jgi:hypothetical protein
MHKILFARIRFMQLFIIHYPLFANANEDAINKIHYPHKGMWIVVLGYVIRGILYLHVRFVLY